MTGTHLVLNQAPPRVDVNEFTLNTPLLEATETFGASWAHPALSGVGALVGGEEFQHDADQAHAHPPVLLTHDRWGHRVDHIQFHPSYHRVIQAAIKHGAHTSCWSDPQAGAHVARAATFSLFAQIEPGHSCPVSMTHAAVPALRINPDLASTWLPRLFSRDYDPRQIDPDAKGSATVGMAMTEKQGGSDVRSNTTAATPHVDGSWRLTGHKWFCSAPQSDGFLILAQTSDGLGCFFVPRRLPSDEPNGLFVQRLKDKLGNKSNASGEIELTDAQGVLLGEPGKGVRTIIEMVNQTRLDCILGSTAGMRQAVTEGLWHTQNRSAFGRPLIEQPAMTAVIADLHLEAEAATWTAMRVASSFDEATDEARAFERLATPIAKYWICKRGPHHAYESMECLGGNGYTEQFPLARRYREQPVMAIWEGSGNVIALDVLRAMRRDPASVDAFLDEVDLARGYDRVLDAHLTALRSLVGAVRTRPDEAEGDARRVVEMMALALQASVLVCEAPADVSQAFIAGRLGPDRCHQYGALPAGLDLKAIVARA